MMKQGEARAVKALILLPNHAELIFGYLASLNRHESISNNSAKTVLEYKKPSGSVSRKLSDSTETQ
jgi:hypothetical protein